MHKKPKILVFIPCYSCAPQVVRVIEQFSSLPSDIVAEILIVDNQSPDNTVEKAVAKTNELKQRVKVSINSGNFGLGGSHKTAFRYAKENGFEYLIVLHGDDQANFHDIAPMIENGSAFEHDCFLGARFMTGSTIQGYSAFRTFGNRVYNLLFRLVNFHEIKDLGSGLNLYRLDKIDLESIQKFPDNLTFNYVMLMWSIWKKHDVQFFPISWREEDQSSNVRLFRQAFRVLTLLGMRAIGPAKDFFSRDHRDVSVSDYVGETVHSNFVD